ncbi:MAG: hypothetical protein Q9227_000053 [Pyrenula ochraceoflavens]
MMLLSLSSLLFFGGLLSSIATATYAPLAQYRKDHPRVSRHPSSRPSVQCSPKSPGSPPPTSAQRNGTICYVQSHNDSVTDDSPYILDAINKCNNGGHVVFTEGTEYIIGTALDLTFLKHIDIGYSKSNNTAKNTDGWDTYRSSGITIQDSTINNGDDCVSFKPNSTDIVVQGLQCNGSHGISVGSLGQYAGEVDLVEDVYVYNISMANASDGARIKVWPGVPSALSGDLQGGGGLGNVRNITYDTMNIANVDYAIEVTQCYGQSNQTLCFQFPSNLTIQDIHFQDFSGTTSKKYDPIVGTIVCSSPNVCSDLYASDINVQSPTGSDEFTCGNVDESLLVGVNCTS